MNTNASNVVRSLKLSNLRIHNAAQLVIQDHKLPRFPHNNWNTAVVIGSLPIVVLHSLLVVNENLPLIFLIYSIQSFSASEFHEKGPKLLLTGFLKTPRIM